MWRSKPTLDDVLAECLSLLEGGEATLEGCLARYPELADDLRPLLLVALRLREGPIASASPATVAEGRRRLLERLAEERAKEPGARLHFPQILPSFSPQARLALSVVAMLIVLSAGVLLARAWVASPVAQTAELLAVSGTVEVLPTGSDTWSPADAGTRLRPGDRVRTGQTAQASLAFFEGSTTLLAPGTEVTIQQMSARRDGSERAILLYQTSGQTTHQVKPSGPDSRFEVVTPVAVAAVLGTRFTVHVQPDDTTHVLVESGVVDVRAQESALAAHEGQEVLVEPGKPPRLLSHQPTPTVTPTAKPLPPSPPPSPTAPAPAATATLTPTPTPRPLPPTPVPPSPVPSSTPAPPPSPLPTLPPTPRPPTSTPTPCCGPPTPSP